MDFLDRFTGRGSQDSGRLTAAPDDESTEPASLQLLFPRPVDLDAKLLTGFLQEYHPDLREARVELHHVVEEPELGAVVTTDGPPAAVVGLIGWADHVVKVISFNAPMPYGPIETCINPAMMPPELKEESRQHQSHMLLYYAGRHPDATEAMVALAATAGALARFEASTVLNEEARSAVPAYDLIPEGEADSLATLRELPLPYFFGGFLKMDVGDAQRPWVRTFANHRFGLPNLAYHLSSHAETSHAFRLFAGLLGYLKTMGESFASGDTLDLGTGTKLHLREPTEAEWYLESTGPMFVIEPLAE